MDPTRKCFVTAEDFHAMYYQCFAGKFQPMYPSQDYMDLKYALIDLLTIDAANRDNTIIQTALKIKDIATKKPMPAIILQLIDAGAKINNGKAFWNMFTFPFEKADKVKNIIYYTHPSDDGTLGILYDLNAQKPLLKVTRDELKGKDYDASRDQVVVSDGDGITIQSGDKVFYFKDAMKDPDHN